MPRVFRPPLWQRLAQLVALVVLALFLLAVGLSQQGLPRYLAEVAGVASLVAAGRGWTLRLVVGSDSVGLVNWFRTVVIPWREIERFGYDGTVWVRCRDMRRYTVSAFANSGRAFAFAQRPARLAAAELEAIRKRRRREGGGRDR